MQLEANKLGFYYEKEAWLFRSVDFSIASGEVVGLLGPSGQGKTSFGKLLARFEVPVEGTVTLDGEPLPKGVNPVQMVLQHPEHAVNPRWKMKRVLEEAGPIDRSLLDRLGIEESWLARWPNELSGGELQRFSVARALMANPSFLIADEMTTMLDAITQAQIWQVVMGIAKERNMGVVVISHDSHLVDRLCDRVVALE